MLPFIWGLCTIFLRILAVLASLLLFILLLLLAGPFLYEVRARGSTTDPDSLRAVIKLSWLVVLLRMELVLTRQEPVFILRILGIPIRKGSGASRRRRKKFQDKKTGEQNSTAAAPEKEAGEQGRAAEALSHEGGEQSETAMASGKTTAGQENSTSVPGRTMTDLNGKSARRRERSADRVKRASEKSGKAAGKRSAGSGGKTAAKSKRKTAGDQKPGAKLPDLLRHRETRVVISLIWSKLVRLIRHIAPRRMEGEVAFGFDDPGTTGIVLALLAAAMPLHRNRLAVSPDFTCETKAAGNIKCSGHFVGAVILYHFLRVLADRNTRHLIRMIRGTAGQKRKG